MTEMRSLWRRAKEHLAAVASRERLPLLVGGVQRGVIESWIRSSAPTAPRAEPLMKVLAALQITGDPFSEYLAHVSPGKSVVHAVCPRCQKSWETTTSTLNRAERRRRGKGLGPMRRRPGGIPVWPCATCARGEIGRKILRDINRPGRIRGRDKKPRARASKSDLHRKNIGYSHLAGARLGKPFQLCPLCGLVRYDRQWHQLCWLAWNWYCRRRKADPTTTAPAIVGRRRGPDPRRRLERNYKLLIHHAMNRASLSELLANRRLTSKIRAKGRRGRRGALRSTSAVFRARQAFLRFAPGSWSLVFSRNDGRNALRQERTPLPQAIARAVEAGSRDTLIARLHRFEMRTDAIARVTGASRDRVQSVIGQ
jgi:hypothetical protein